MPLKEYVQPGASLRLAGRLSAARDATRLLRRPFCYLRMLAGITQHPSTAATATMLVELTRILAGPEHAPYCCVPHQNLIHTCSRAKR